MCDLVLLVLLLSVPGAPGFFLHLAATATARGDGARGDLGDGGSGGEGTSGDG